VPGVGHSPDKMLQARIFSYADAHRYRVGVNAEQLSVNKPRCPGASLSRRRHHAARRHTQPGRLLRAHSMGGPVEDLSVKEPPLPISGNADRYNHRDANDDYRQGRRPVPADERRSERSSCSTTSRPRWMACRRRSSSARSAHFYRADPDYGIGVATRMGLSANDLPTAQAAE